MKFPKVSYLITILLCMVIIDCSPSAYKDSKIIGKWTGYVQIPNVDVMQEKLTIEFFKDKTCVTWVGDSAKWVILEDNRIKIDTSEQMFLFKLENGVLTLENPTILGGGNMIFKKVNKNR